MKEHNYGWFYTVFIACLLLAMQTVAGAAARYTFTLHDARAKAYKVSLVAKDEKVDYPEPYSAYAEGDRRAAGHYFASLQRTGWKAPVRQAVKLFTTEDGSGEFNLNREMVYVLKGGKKQPDLLVVTQYGASNWDTATVFYVQQDKLRQATFKWKTRVIGREISFTTDKPHRLHGTGAFTFYSACYDNTQGAFLCITWSFSPATGMLTEKKRTSIPL
jgi:hypothetical protein